MLNTVGTSVPWVLSLHAEDKQVLPVATIVLFVVEVQILVLTSVLTSS